MQTDEEEQKLHDYNDDVNKVASRHDFDIQRLKKKLKKRIMDYQKE